MGANLGKMPCQATGGSASPNCLIGRKTVRMLSKSDFNRSSGSIAWAANDNCRPDCECNGDISPTIAQGC